MQESQNQKLIEEITTAVGNLKGCSRDEIIQKFRDQGITLSEALASFFEELAKYAPDSIMEYAEKHLASDKGSVISPAIASYFTRLAAYSPQQRATFFAEEWVEML